MTHADRVFANARFHTLAGDAAPAAGALATWQGRILAVGHANEVLDHAGPDTEVVDLGGAVVLPGFIEPHMHPLAAGVQMSAPQIGTHPVRPSDR